MNYWKLIGMCVIACVFTACKNEKPKIVDDMIYTEKIQSELLGQNEERVRIWLQNHCGPFEYLSHDELVRTHSHVPDEVLRECTGRYQALLNRRDDAFKPTEKNKTYDVDVAIYVNTERKVFRVDFEIISDGM